MENYINYKIHADGYGIITLNRPEKRNAISFQMAESLLHIIKRAAQDEITCLVVRSSNVDVFCAGGDLQDFHNNMTYEEAFSQLYVMKEVLFELVSFPVPTICLLAGNAFGGGCELATACDIRIARDCSSFGFIQTNLGIVPGWGGGSLLYEKVPSSFAFHWITEAGTYDAKYLYNQGWIQKVVKINNWDEENILEPYINNSIEQMRILKIQYKENISSLSLSAKMSEDVRHCATLWNSPEHNRAINHFLNNR